LPGGVGVAAEYQLTPWGVDLQKLRAVGMAPERGGDHEPRGDLLSSVDDVCLVGKHLPLNFYDRLRGIAADRAPRAGLRRWPYLGFSDRINGIHRADMPAVELDRVIEKEVDLLQLLLLDVEHGVREGVELAGVVPVTVSNNDPGDSIRIQPDVFHLVGKVPPAARGVPIKDIRELLPTAIVQGDSAVLPFDNPDIDGQVDELNVVPGGRDADKVPIRHECAKRDVHKPAAFDQPHGVQRRVLCLYQIAQQLLGTLEALWQCLRRPPILLIRLISTQDIATEDSRYHRQHSKNPHE